jgi:hypothetical protein
MKLTYKFATALSIFLLLYIGFHNKNHLYYTVFHNHEQHQRQQFTSQLILCVPLYFIFTNNNNGRLFCPVSEPELFSKLADMCDRAQNCYASKRVGIKLLGISHAKLENAATGKGFTFKQIHCIALYFYYPKNFPHFNYLTFYMLSPTFSTE